MLDIVTTLRECKSDGAKLATAIDLYLSKNIFSGRIFDMISRVNPRDWWDILDDTKNAFMAPQLLATCRRALESTPDHPGLLLIEGIGSVWLSNPDPDRISASLAAGLNSLVDRYGGTEEVAADVAREIVERIVQIDGGVFADVTRIMVLNRRHKLFASAAYQHVTDPELRRACAVPWITEITSTARAIRDRHLGVMREGTDD
jgi:hypothetical protein